MITINATYYDGRSSAQIPVTVSFTESGRVVIQGETLSLTTTLNQLSISDRLGNTRRSLFLAGGAKLETDDNEAVDKICRRFAKQRWQAAVHQWEQRWLTVCLALIISITIVWAGIEYGVPIAAKWAAKALPHSIEEQLGKQTLTTLDKWIFNASHIDTAQQTQVQLNFQQITPKSGDTYRYRLLLRDSPKMGANAIALPGGIIIATDALLELAENNEQLLAVLAHEMGHIEYQHGIRSLLQDSFTAILMIGLLGDLSSISSLSATLPTMLVESRYSRQFEQEADRYAMERLHEQKIDSTQFIHILTLLEQQHGETEFDYLSSHPAMSKRIELIKSLSTR